MSVFVDTLAKSGQQSASPMGFGPASRQHEASPPVMLAGRVTPQQLAKEPGLADARVDALVLWLDSGGEVALDGVIDQLRERLWGVRLGAVSTDQAKQLKAKGCDFVLFEAEDTEAGVLDLEDLGKFISVSGELDEDTARAINELYIDGTFFTPGDDLLPLTVRKLIEIEQARGLVGKPFLLAAPAALSSVDLEALSNAAIAGLVVELSSLDDIVRIKEAIDKLPRQSASPVHRDALVPYIAPQAATHPPSPDEGDDEDDE